MQPAKFGVSFVVLALTALDVSAANLRQQGSHQNLHFPKGVEDATKLEDMVLNMAKLNVEPSWSSDMQKLLSDFEGAVNSSHSAAQTLLNNHVVAFSNCSDSRSNGNSAVSALLTTKDGLALDHKQCRVAEAEKYNAFETCNSTVQASKTIKDSRCKVYQDLVHTPGPAHVPAPKEGEDWATWVERVKDWSTTTLQDLSKNKGLCEDATEDYDDKHESCFETEGHSNSSQQVHEEKRTSCNSLQVHFEAASCAYAAKIEDVCSDYQQCYNASKSTWGSDLPQIQAGEASRKNEWWMIQRIRCYFRVLREEDKVDSAALEECKTKSHNSDFLTLTVPAIPGAPTTCPSETKPCSDGFLSHEYGALPSGAPADGCIPCGGAAGDAGA